jgi:mycothiol synthase
MNLRPLHQSDLTNLLALWNRSAPHDPLNTALLHEKIWEDVNFDARFTFGAEADGPLAGFIVGVVRDRPAGRVGYIKLLAVDEAFRQRETGSRLLEALEHRLATAEVTEIRVGESAPNYLTPGVDVRYEAAQHFFEAHGYLRFAETHNMHADLVAHDFQTGEAERALAREGIEVRRAMAGDTVPVLQFLAGQDWAAWTEEVRRCFRNAPISLHLARRNGDVVGFAAYDSNNVGTGWFGPMGTAEAARRQGIGGVLLKRCLRDLRAQGRTLATIPWVGPLEFYTDQVGAAVCRRFVRYQKRLG